MGYTLRALVVGVTLARLNCQGAWGQESDLSRFQRDLSSAALGNAVPIPDGGNGMYLGVVIIPPGEAWSPTTGEDDVMDRGPWGASPIALQFNYPITVRGGVPYLRRQQRLEKIWQRLLTASVPSAKLPTALQSPELFRAPDRVDQARRVERLRQPSERYLKYQEYRSAWLVLTGLRPGDDNWRFLPRFSGYSSVDEARIHTLADWKRFGYKVEIEAAIEQLDQEQLPGAWRSWLEGNDAFRANTIDVVPGIPSGRTTMFPSDSEWPSMRSWSNMHFQSSSGATISCQIARVKILRPWLDWSVILDPEFKLTKASGLGVVSDGAVPTNDDFATGQAPNIVEELVLVRRIQGASSGSGHPLARFEYPEAINLIAYVVRSLPVVAAQD